MEHGKNRYTPEEMEQIPLSQHVQYEKRDGPLWFDGVELPEVEE